jgi:CBS domain-containing protein
MPLVVMLSIMLRELQALKKGDVPMRATDVMLTSFATVKPGAALIDVVRLLLETNQRGLPVVDDDGDIVGIISEGISCIEMNWV